MNTLKNHILLLCFICTQMALGQVTFEAKVSRDNVPLNENVRIDFSMNSDGDNFSPPNFGELQIVGGPNQSVNYSWINGKKSFNKTYSYFVQAKRKGKYTIGSASIEIEGKIYKTNPITVTITDAVAKQDPRERINTIQQQSLDDIHLVAEVTNSNPYINEPITVSYKIYFKDGLRGYSGTKIPTYDKFWVYNIPPTRDPEIKQGKFKGEPYNYILIKQDVIMAQELGDFTIDPLGLLVQAQVLTGRRDFFGFPEYGFMEKEYYTNKIVIKSKDIPQKGKPDNFSGGVGDFDFKVIPSKKELKAGETLTLKVEVNGKGNLNLLNIPEPKAHSALEIYDPVYSEKLNAGAFGMQGRRTNEYTIIPQYKGNYTIEPMEFSYFDLSSKKYKTIQTDSIQIAVLEGPTLPTNKEILGDEIIEESELFQPIKIKATFVNAYKDKYWNTSLFYSLTAIPFLAIPFFILVIRRKRAKDGDIEGNKLRRNNKLARKYLSEAKKHITSKELFYEALERCLHNFLKAKLKIETTEMSNENIEDLLKENNVNQEGILSFMNLKNACEWARYTPSDKVDMLKDYDSAINIITQLEKQIK